MMSDQEKVPVWLKWEQLSRTCQEERLRRSPGAIQVMRVLLDDFDRDGRRLCFPSLDRLANNAGLSRRSVVTALDKLTEAGMIQREKGGGRGRSTRYRFPWIERRLNELVTGGRGDREASKATPTREMAGSDNKKSENAKRSRTADKPSEPARQGHFMLPIDGQSAQESAARKVSQRFRVRREDAAAMVQHWCQQAEPKAVVAAIDAAMAEGIDREELARFVTRRIKKADCRIDAETAPTDRSGDPGDTDVSHDSRWRAVKTRMRKEVPQGQYKAWLQDLTFVRIENGCAIMSAGSRFKAEWVRGNFADRLRACWEAIEDGVREVRIVAYDDVGSRSDTDQVPVPDGPEMQNQTTYPTAARIA